MPLFRFLVAACCPQCPLACNSIPPLSASAFLCVSVPLLVPNFPLSDSYKGFRVHPAFPDGSDSKASACNAGDLSSIPGLERSLEKEMAIHSSTLACKIPWKEETDRPHPLGITECRTRLKSSDFTSLHFRLSKMISS